MRLLTVGSLPPEWGGSQRGGAATFHAALLAALHGRADIDIVGVLPPEPLRRTIPVPAWVRPDGISRGRFYEELLTRLRPDVVLMSHIAHTVGVTHARLESPPPALGVVHSWHNVTFKEGAERRRAVELTEEALSGLSAMVTPSRHALVEGWRLGFRYPAQHEAIHNPVPLLYMGDDLGARSQERAGVVFLGGLISRKQPLALVDAAALLPGLAVSLIGTGPQEGEVCERVAALGIEDRVRLARPPAGEGHTAWIRAALLRAEALCLPSHSEALPMAFVEALACGTPIVGFGPAVREIRDELGIEVGEPLDSGDPEGIAAALERVLSARWDRRGLRRATLSHFGLDRVADRYVELLSGVARSGSSGAGGPCRSAGGDGAVICVLGMSRSGTSLTARVLNLAGVSLGPEEELLGKDLIHLAAEGEAVLERADYSNPGGHWEHYRLMRLNERILRILGGSWRAPPPMPFGWELSAELDPLRDEARAIIAESFAGQALWAWKDPRNSLTLPFWQGLLPKMRYVICLRNPIEVATSLQRRDGIPIEGGARQWLRYLVAALINTSGRMRLLVPFESYFQDPAGTAARLARFAGREGAFDGASGERMLAEAIDERLWRSRVSGEDAGGAERVSSEACSLFRVAELLAMIGDEDGAGRLHSAADRYATSLSSRALPALPAMS